MRNGGKFERVSTEGDQFDAQFLQGGDLAFHDLVFRRIDLNGQRIKQRLNGDIAALILGKKLIVAHALLRGVLIHDNEFVVLFQKKIGAEHLPDHAVHRLRLRQFLLYFLLLLTHFAEVVHYRALDLAFLTENDLTIVLEGQEGEVLLRRGLFSRDVIRNVEEFLRGLQRLLRLVADGIKLDAALFYIAFQSVFDGVINSGKDLISVAKAHFRLCWMDVDVDFGRRKLDRQDRHGIVALHQILLINGGNGGGDILVFADAPVDNGNLIGAIHLEVSASAGKARYHDAVLLIIDGKKVLPHILAENALDGVSEPFAVRCVDLFVLIKQRDRNAGIGKDQAQNGVFDVGKLAGRRL